MARRQRDRAARAAALERGTIARPMSASRSARFRARTDPRRSWRRRWSRIDAAGRACDHRARCGGLSGRGRQPDHRRAAHRAATRPISGCSCSARVFGMLCHQRGVLPIHAAVGRDRWRRRWPLPALRARENPRWRRRFCAPGTAILSDDVAPSMDRSGGRHDPARAFGGSGYGRIRPPMPMGRGRIWSDAGPGWRNSAAGSAAMADGRLRRRRSSIFGSDRASSAAPRFRRLRGARRGAGADQPGLSLAARSSGSRDWAAAMLRATRGAGLFPRHFVMERPLHIDRLDETIDGIVAMVRAGR